MQVNKPSNLSGTNETTKANNNENAKPKIDSTLEKIGQNIHEKTRKGTFVGDNMLLSGAGAAVGAVAAGSALHKTAEAIPAVKEVLKTVFVDNAALVGSGVVLGASALLAEDAVAAYKEGQTGRAVAEGTGAAITGLGAVELTGRHFNIPVLNQALSAPVKATAKFIENHGVGLLGGATAAAGAALAKSGVQDLKDKEYLKASSKMAGGSLVTLAGAEVLGQAYDVGPLKGIISTPAKKVAEVGAKNAGALGGTALAGAGAALAKSGVKDLEKGDSMIGGAKLAAGGTAVLGGTELIGRNFDIPVLKQALSGPSEWIGNNPQAITGGVAMAGGAAALKHGVDRLKAGENGWLAGAEIAGGTVGVLGGAELVGRNFDIPVLKEALTGPVKYMFTSKGGLSLSGGAVATAGLAAAGDGMRRLTTEKGLLNDAVGVAEFTAGVAGVTGGASIIGYATGSEKLTKVFAENLDVLGGAALAGTAVAMGKHTVDSVRKEGVTLLNTATGTGAGLAGATGAYVIAEKFGVPAAERLFTKSANTVAATGLGVATVKLGEKALTESKAFVKNSDDLAAGAKALALGTGALATGTAATGLAGNVLQIKALEKGAVTVAENGWKPVTAVALGATTYKLGDWTADQGKAFLKDPSLEGGLATAGLATATVLTGAGTTALVGNTLNLPPVERAGMKVLEKTAQGVEVGARALGQGAEKVFSAAVQHPFVTLGVLAAAAGTGYYLYNREQATEAKASADKPIADKPVAEKVLVGAAGQ